MKISRINRKTASIVNPKILKGNKSSQTIGNRNNIINAIGQHTTNSKHQRAKAINVLIVDV